MFSSDGCNLDLEMKNQKKGSNVYEKWKHQVMQCDVMTMNVTRVGGACL
jgi:hypothetical protein